MPVKRPTEAQTAFSQARSATRQLLESLAPSPPSQGFGGFVGDLRNQLLEIDPNVSTEGIPDFGFRAKLSRMDTPQEREKSLTDKLGKEGWGLDTFGHYMVKPEGLKRLGLPPSDKPVRIDEPSLTRYDFADLSGEAPALGGALTGAALLAATGGAAWPVAVPLMGLATAAGKATGELIEEQRGENLQTFPQVAADVGIEGLFGAAGEGAMRGLLMPFGRKVMAPQAHRMTPEGRALTKEAQEIGAQPTITQITRAPLLGRIQSMVDLIFGGNPAAVKNAAALNAEIKRIRTSVFSGKLSSSQVGAAVKADIGTARKALGRWAETISDGIDKLTGGLAVVPTRQLREAAGEVLDLLPKHKQTGKALFTAPETSASLGNIISGLDDFVTVGEMTRITGRLWNAVDDATIIPGVSSHDARQLWRAARKTFDDAGDFAGTTRTPRVTVEGRPYTETQYNVRQSLANKPEVVEAIKTFKTQYASKIKEFGSALVKRIMRDPKFAGALEPEQVVSGMFRKGLHTPLARVMKLLSPETKNKVRAIAMDDVLASISARTDDPLISVFTGKNFLNALDGYGHATLKAIFGATKASELFRLGRVTSLVTGRMKLSGGIVAANIALHPIRNLGKLVQLRILSKFMNSKTGIKWLTEGIRAPRTRAGISALARTMVQSQALLDEHTRETEVAQ